MCIVKCLSSYHLQSIPKVKAGCVNHIELVISVFVKHGFFFPSIGHTPVFPFFSVTRKLHAILNLM